MKRKLPNSESCFVCGSSNTAGLGLHFTLQDGVVEAEWTPQPHHNGYQGIAHGGVVASLLDEAMGWAPSVANKLFCVAVELNVEYRKPVPIGAAMRVRAWATETGRRIWCAEGEVIGPDGAVHARGKGRYMPLDREKTLGVISYLKFDEDTVPAEELCVD
jgi:uncharacterized protein (TIGR00369 family)